jgi:aspartyl/asparaginyl beta-hydroxylase (cupin superfamily)
VGDDPRTGAPAHDSGEWNVFYLDLHNVDFAANRARCPKTVALLEAMGRPYGHAFFSAMAPGTHIVKHHGPTNKKVRVHLPLVVPGLDSCRLRAGAPDNVRTFQEGKSLIFDDSFEHEAWNDASSCRINLIFDVWHPDLTDAEVKFFDILRRARMRAEKRMVEAATRAEENDASESVHGEVDAAQPSANKKGGAEGPSATMHGTKAGEAAGEEGQHDGRDNLYSIIEATRSMRPDEEKLWA